MSDIPKLTVETHSNHIHFYSEIDEDRALALIQELDSMDDQFRGETITRRVDHKTPIWLHIHSPGGNAFASFAVADHIQSLASPVYSVVEGLAASGATIISMACTKRFITPNSFLLIHQLSSFMFGTYEQFKDNAVLQDALMNQIAEFYTKRSKFSRAEIDELLKHDSWFTAVQALEKGLVDEVYR